jgi:peptide/nickel transport system permease protein
MATERIEISDSGKKATGVRRAVGSGASAVPRRRDTLRINVRWIVLVVVRRCATLIPTALLSTVVIFLLVRIVPGGPAQAKLGIYATASAIAALDAQMGLNHPIVVQYMTWLGGLLRGNLGTSLETGQAVSTTIGQTLPVTAELVALAALWSVLLAVPAGVLAASRRGSRLDRLITGSSGIGLAFPDFFLAIVLVDVLAVALHLFPVLGFTRLTLDPAKNLYYMFLPSVTMGFGAAAIVVRQVRGAMVTAIEGDFITTARAMGIRGSRILWRYGLRNALPTILNVYGLLLIGMLGATVVIEQIFVLPGLGNSLMEAISNRDYTMIEGIVIIYIAIVVALNLVVDVTVAMINPRLR